MKTVIVLTSSYPKHKTDSAGNFVHELAKRLAGSFRVIVVAPMGVNTPPTLSYDGVTIIRFGSLLAKMGMGDTALLPQIRKQPLYIILIPYFVITQFWCAYKAIKKEGASVVHAHWIVPQGAIAYLLKLLTGVPYVVTAHGGDVFGLKGWPFSAIKKAVLKSAQSITGVSAAIKSELYTLLGNSAAITVLPMGVDGNLFKQDNADRTLRTSYRITGPFLLFVGRLSEKKGVEYLIRAMPEVIEKHPDCKLLIVGGGELDEQLKQLSKSYNLESHVFFTGPVPNTELPKYYASADIFIGPSIVAQGGDTEGFGLTFVEAGMSGCWLIGTQVGGISDIIVNGQNGFLIPEKDPQAIATAIFDSFSHIGTRNRFDFSKYDWARIAEQYKFILNGGQ